MNLAYYFAYDYTVPQDVPRYADPLVKSVHAWTTTWKHAELVSVDLETARNAGVRICLARYGFGFADLAPGTLKGDEWLADSPRAIAALIGV